MLMGGQLQNSDVKPRASDLEGDASLPCWLRPRQRFSASSCVSIAALSRMSAAAAER
jgi:hypothetical protein